MRFRGLHRLRRLFASILGRSATDKECTDRRSPIIDSKTSESDPMVGAGGRRRKTVDRESSTTTVPTSRAVERPGTRTRLSGTEDAAECDVVVGLDFGTSRTKVVVRTPDLHDERALAVSFETHGESSNPYLLPTQIWLDAQGICRLEPSEGRHVEDIKVGLFQNIEDFDRNGSSKEQSYLDPETMAVAYLTLVLQYTRAWFLKTQKDVISHFRTLNWAVNLGVPSPYVGTNETSSRFRRVGHAACLLSERESPRLQVGVDEAEEALKAIDADGFGDDVGRWKCDFDIKPEIVAAAVGYAHSDQRREGVHLMIDVGASTLDVCTFLLHQNDGSDRYSLLTTNVEPLGTFRLVQQDRHELSKECAVMLRKVIQELLPPNGLAAREDIFRAHGRLPIFLTGGGSKHRFYIGCVDELEDAIRNVFRVNNKGIRRLQLPVPNTAADDAAAVFHRLAVAWGLSYRAVDIGDVLPPEEIERPEPLGRITWEDRYLSKDQM